MDRAELILTDPPYDMKAQELRETFGRFADKAVFLCSDNQGYHFCLDGWEYKIGMVWIHKQPRSKKSPYFPINYHTPILIAQKGKEKLGWRRSEPGTGSIIEIEAYENDITGHAKRPALFEEMVRGFSASTVIDPFFGTGSSLVACVNQKKNMTGIEIDPAMLGLALDRFERLGYEIKEMPSNRP